LQTFNLLRISNPRTFKAVCICFQALSISIDCNCLAKFKRFEGILKHTISPVVNHLISTWSTYFAWSSFAIDSLCWICYFYYNSSCIL